ncbi:zinc finger protein 395a [Aplochiton taeniatus]
MLPKSRLGKRSPLGALVCTSCPSLEGPLETGLHGNLEGAESKTPGRVKLHPGQKVFVWCGGRECSGVVQQHNHVDNKVSILVPALGQHILRKAEDVWTSPSAPPPSPSAAHPKSTGQLHPVSSCIDVPRRSAESVEMDEMMAAMVLTSLSGSPLVQSPLQRDSVAAPAGMECGGGELSDSSSSGYWSVDCGNRSPTPSPPITEADGSLAPPSDEGLDMELEQVLFDEPAPRKRRNSVKVAYRCLWPNCGKVLTSVVGIKRHVRTLHLGCQSGEHERCSRSEEDFYYTEIHQRDQHPLTPPPATHSPICSPALSQTTPRPTCASSPPAFDQPGERDGAGLDSPTDEAPPPGLLSQSAPSVSKSFWQVQFEHSYQASVPVQVVTPPPPNSMPFQGTTSASSTHCKQGLTSRVRSLSVGEQWLQQHSAPIRPHPPSISPPRVHWATRRVRGEAKKCRKVYGIEHRDQWCTACRWKKACQRFLD